MIYLFAIAGIVFAALGGFGLWEKHRADAADARADALEAQVEIAAAANLDLTAKLKVLQADADRFADAAKRQQAKSAHAIAEAAKQQEADAAQISRLAAIVNRPPSHDEQACARADAVLRDLIGLRD